METRSEILGLLTDLIEDEVSLEETAPGLEAIAKLGDMPSTDAEDAMLDELLVDIIDAFNEKRARLRSKAQSAVHENNQKQKEQIIEEMRALIQNEENIGKAFNSFKDLQEKWQDIGDIPRAQLSRLQGEYSRLRETFFYNIQIYKELAEHDKRRNLVNKRDIIKKVQLLADETSIKKVDAAVKMYMKEWDSTGPTSQKDWEQVRDDYWKSVRAALDRVNAYYEGIREKQGENLEKKKALIAKVTEVSEREIEGVKAWNSSTNEVLDIQKQWKSIGFSSQNEKVWKEFRGACDSFFTRKKNYYGDLNEVYDTRKAKKEALIAKAAELKTGQNFKETSIALQALQKEWKAVGAASKKDENKLWSKFRGHCDEFFNKKTEFFKGKEADEKQNLKLKEDLTRRVQAFQLSGNKGTDLNALAEFGVEWRGIGMVPFKEKDKVNKTYFESISVHYDKLKLDDKERKEVQMKNRLAKLENDPKAKKDERFHIKRKIDGLRKDINQYENNLGFFNPHQKDNPMKLEVEKNIKRNKAKIAELQKMLKLIDNS